LIPSGLRALRTVADGPPDDRARPVLERPG
jgi:hypothetical protein